MNVIFLHGLDSSSKATKARWFRQNFPEILIPDFAGVLDERMNKLKALLAGKKDLVLIGSSFGGLMASILAQEDETRVKKVILLAPALNFPDFSGRRMQRVNVLAHLYIGRQDTVCPPDIVIPFAKQIFRDLSVHITDDDHQLQKTFARIDWSSILLPEIRSGA